MNRETIDEIRREAADLANQWDRPTAREVCRLLVRLIDTIAPAAAE
jgi:hypothetical protein